MDLEEVVGIWQQYVTQLADLLKSLESKRGMSQARHASQERLAQLSGEACVFLMRFALASPITSKVCVPEGQAGPVMKTIKSFVCLCACALSACHLVDLLASSHVCRSFLHVFFSAWLP